MKDLRVLAIVGDQPILVGDVLGQVNEMLAPYKDEMTAEQYTEQREKLIQHLLPRLVERKLLYLDFLRTIPPDRIPEMEYRVADHFNKKRLPEIISKTNVTSAAELDQTLRQLGSSLANQQRMFFEQVAAEQNLSQHAKINEEITHEQLLEYYRTHEEDYSFPSKARWERLTTRFDRFSTKTEAYNALVAMGNEVLGGAPLSAVAKRSSQGPKSADGGQYDWTTQGSLVSTKIDELIFSIPVGHLSQIIEDGDAYHIVRVTEREMAGKLSFLDVQSEIAEKIKEQRFSTEAKSYIASLRESTYIWTAFELETGDAPTE